MVAVRGDTHYVQVNEIHCGAIITCLNCPVATEIHSDKTLVEFGGMTLDDLINPQESDGPFVGPRSLRPAPPLFLGES